MYLFEGINIYCNKFILKTSSKNSVLVHLEELVTREVRLVILAQSTVSAPRLKHGACPALWGVAQARKAWGWGSIPSGSQSPVGPTCRLL